MFDIGAAELLVVIIVAVLVIGPKDMPLAMNTAGRWIGKVRKISAHFRTGIDAMVREAELEDMEKKWKAQNEAIMSRSSGSDDAAGDDPSSEEIKSDDAPSQTDQMTGPPPKPQSVDAPGSPPASAESAAPEKSGK